MTLIRHPWQKWLSWPVLLGLLLACTQAPATLDQRARALLLGLIQAPEDIEGLAKYAGLPSEKLQAIRQDRDIGLVLDYLNARHRQGVALRVDVYRRSVDKSGGLRRIGLLVYEKDPGAEKTVPRYRFEMVFIRKQNDKDWQLSSLREQESAK